MPSHIVSHQTDEQTGPRVHQRKLIRKESKIARQRSLKTSAEVDCEDSTMAQSNILPTLTEEFTSLKEVVFLLKDITVRFRYAMDTYFVCLSLLAKVRSQIPEERSRLMVAALLLLSAKVHEFRTPRFMDVIRWGGEQFNSQDLITAEAELLMYFGFRVPVVLEVKNERELGLEVKRLEKKLLQSVTPFQ